MSTTTIPLIDVPLALGLLRRAVSTKPEGYSYEFTDEENASSFKPSCEYIGSNNQPRCIVGVALSLHTPDRWTSIPSVVTNTSATALVADEIATRNAAAVFKAAQMAQDAGETWATAVERADRLAVVLLGVTA